ncbi:hypothetical protein Tco_0201924 [Tanacetum coccineum]
MKRISSSVALCMLPILERTEKSYGNVWQGGSSCKSADMLDFQESIKENGIEDLNCSGIHFTWVQSRLNPSSGILKKIDRIMGNSEFIGTYLNAHAVFLPHMTSDHSLGVLIMPQMLDKKKKAFIFANFVAEKMSL